MGMDHGSMRYSECADATYGSTSLSVTCCVEAMLLAAATSSARRAVFRSYAALTSLVAANPHPFPISTRTPTARSTVEERWSTSPLRTFTCC